LVMSPTLEQAKSVLEGFARIPQQERPLIILAMREKDSQVESLARDLLGNESIRNDTDKDTMTLEKIGTKTVFIINTQGEMLTDRADFPGFLFAADAVISSNNRNLFEPT